MGKAVVQYHGRNCRIRNLHVYLFPIDLLGVGGVVDIVKSDCYLTAFSRKLLRCNLLSVQIVSHLLGNRGFLGGISSIVDILAICLPGQFLSVGRIGLIPLGILDIRKLRIVADGIRIRIVDQMIGYDGVMHVAVCICENIHIFFLADFLIIHLNREQV